MVGFGSGEGTLDKRYVRSVLEISGKIHVDRKLRIGGGSRLAVSGELHVGSMTNTSRLHLVCMHEMRFGYDVLVGWDTVIMDSDMHVIKEVATGRELEKNRAVSISDNVWIGTRAVILKGTSLPKGCIVGAGAVVGGSFAVPDSVIAGNPAGIVKSGFTLVK